MSASPVPHVTHRAVVVGLGACGARERTAPATDRFAIKNQGVTCPPCLSWIAAKQDRAKAERGPTPPLGLNQQINERT